MHQRVLLAAYSAMSAMFVLSTKDGPVSTGSTAAEVVLVGQVEPQRVNGHVALQLRLLIDGEQDLAVLDLLGHIGVQVEGDELGRAV